MKIQAFCIREDPRRASGDQGIALLETCSAGACLKLGVAPLWQVDVEGSCLRGRGRKSRRRARAGGDMSTCSICHQPRSNGGVSICRSTPSMYIRHTQRPSRHFCARA